MRLPLPAWSRSVRMQHCVAWAALAAWSGCLGGQTGTEAVPSDAGRETPQGNGTGATVGSDTATTPTTNTGCVAPADAGTTLDATSAITDGAVVAFVQAANPVKFRYDDGVVANATLTIVPIAAGCQAQTSSGPASLSIPVTAHLTTDDARVELSLTGTAVAYAAAGGGIAEVEVTGVAQCVRTIDPATLVPCAIVGLDQSPYAALSIGLSARVQSIAGAAQWLGTVRVLGSAAGTCSPEPCSIIDWVAVATMSLSSLP